jgi:hypothetical protein
MADYRQDAVGLRGADSRPQYRAQHLNHRFVARDSSGHRGQSNREPTRSDPKPVSRNGVRHNDRGHLTAAQVSRRGPAGRSASARVRARSTGPALPPPPLRPGVRPARGHSDAAAHQRPDLAVKNRSRTAASKPIRLRAVRTVRGRPTCAHQTLPLRYRPRARQRRMLSAGRTAAHPRPPVPGSRR